MSSANDFRLVVLQKMFTALNDVNWSDGMDGAEEANSFLIACYVMVTFMQINQAGKERRGGNLPSERQAISRCLVLGMYTVRNLNDELHDNLALQLRVAYSAFLGAANILVSHLAQPPTTNCWHLKTVVDGLIRFVDESSAFDTPEIQRLLHVSDAQPSNAQSCINTWRQANLNLAPTPVLPKLGPPAGTSTRAPKPAPKRKRLSDVLVIKHNPPSVSLVLKTVRKPHFTKAIKKSSSGPARARRTGKLGALAPLHLSNPTAAPTSRSATVESVQISTPIDTLPDTARVLSGSGSASLSAFDRLPFLADTSMFDGMSTLDEEFDESLATHAKQLSEPSLTEKTSSLGLGLGLVDVTVPVGEDVVMQELQFPMVDGQNSFLFGSISTASASSSANARVLHQEQDRNNMASSSTSASVSNTSVTSKRTKGRAVIKGKKGRPPGLRFDEDTPVVRTASAHAPPTLNDTAMNVDTATVAPTIADLEPVAPLEMHVIPTAANAQGAVEASSDELMPTLTSISIPAPTSMSVDPELQAIFDTFIVSPGPQHVDHGAPVLGNTHLALAHAPVIPRAPTPSDASMDIDSVLIATPAVAVIQAESPVDKEMPMIPSTASDPVDVVEAPFVEPALVPTAAPGQNMTQVDPIINTIYDTFVSSMLAQFPAPTPVPLVDPVSYHWLQSGFVLQ